MEHPNLDLMRRYSAAILDGRIVEMWVRDWDEAAYDAFFADAPA